MAQEIERKFLVCGEFKSRAIRVERICQGYLSSVPERTVRVRLQGEQGCLTVKGAGDASGVSRYEWETKIAAEEALELLRLCEPGVIDKSRHYVPVGQHLFEVDEFHGENAGLVVAEVELHAPDEPFERPERLGKEVTGDVRYYNAVLSRAPYSTWKN